MTLKEFISSKRWALTRFEISWEICHRDKPDKYPLKMQPGDWQGQFDLYDTFETSWENGDEP